MNELDKNKPHGLGIGFKAEVFDNVDGKLIPVQSNEENGSKLEAYINIKNGKTGKEVELPMRSFVQTFLTILYRYFTGSDNATDAYTRNSTASTGAISGNDANAFKSGLLAGHGITGVTLSDNDIETQASHASLSYGAATFIAPYVADVNSRTMKFELRRMLTSVKATTTYISELAVKILAVGATAGAAGNTISRDLLLSTTSIENELGTPNGIPLSTDEGIAFQFKFKISQVLSGANQGGAVLNFVKMIFNQLFKGNPNGSQLLDDNGANLTLSYGNASIASGASIANPFHIVDAAATTNYGILVGLFNNREPGENPPINCDDYKFDLVTSGLTIGVTDVAAITNPSKANTAQFIVSRLFTNSGTTAIKLNRAGLKIKGDAFIAINTLAVPSGDIPSYLTLQPNQVLKVSYPFEIQA